MEKIFKPSQTGNAMVWSLVLLVIIDVPLILFLLLGFQGPTFFFIMMGTIFILIDGLVLSLGFLGKRMSYRLDEDNFTVNFGLSKRKIPYSSIRDVQLSHTTLLLRLFGASWPGLHWGLYKAKDIGRVWAYSTKMKGDFVVINLVDNNKIVISPEDSEAFLNEIGTWKSRFGTSDPDEVEGFKTSARVIYVQVVAVAAAFLAFLGYVLWIYPSLPEVIPVHFDFNWTPNRWGHKSELFIIAGVAAIFPAINTILALKFGRYGKELTIFLGAVFIFVIALFFGIVYFTQTVI